MTDWYIQHKITQWWCKLNHDETTLRAKLGPVRKCLYAAQAFPRVHPYLNCTAHIPCPNSQYPGDLLQHELTMEEVLRLLHNGPINWLPYPWYHDEEAAGPPHHFNWNINTCVYCDDRGHPTCDCPDPHHFCPDCLSCIIPSYHKNFRCWCPTDYQHHLLDMVLNALEDYVGEG